MSKRMIICILVLLSILGSFLCSCDRDGEGTVRPSKQEEGSEPDDPPPPPPPPPDDSNSSGSMLTTSNSLTLEAIADGVLRGDYGHELQQILSAEVSSCINQMQSEEVVSITTNHDVVIIKELEGNKGGIMFNPFYIAGDILAGKYGSGPRLALCILMKGSSEKVIK
jgi:hypothetical protein